MVNIDVFGPITCWKVFPSLRKLSRKNSINRSSSDALKVNTSKSRPRGHLLACGSESCVDASPFERDSFAYGVLEAVIGSMERSLALRSKYT